MAVRTAQVGVKNKRRVNARAAQVSQGSTQSRRKTLPRDDEAALRRTRSQTRMKPGPLAEEELKTYERRHGGTAVQGRKKSPSQMHVKRKGGPFKKTRLHGG